MGDPVEFNEKRPVSYGLMIRAVVSAIIATFFITMVWARFLFLETEIVTAKASFRAELKTLSARVDKRYARVVERLEELEAK